MLVIKAANEPNRAEITLVFPSNSQAVEVQAWWNSLRFGAEVGFELRDYNPDAILPKIVIAGRAFWTPPLGVEDANADSDGFPNVRRG